jgi:hypothetical protein
MQQPDDAVTRSFLGARRSAHPKTANIDANCPVNYVRDDISGNDHARIGAGLSWLILDMLPNQSGTFRPCLDIEK